MASEKMEQLRAAKGLLAQTDLLATREKFKELDRRLMEALQTKAFVQAGLIELPDGAVNPEDGIKQIQNEWNALAAEVERFEKATKDRLLILLSLVRSPGMSAKLGNTQELNDEIE